MLSRSDRHRKNHKESKWPVKRLVAWIAAIAAVCLILVLGAIYLFSQSNQATMNQGKTPLAVSAAPTSSAAVTTKPEATPKPDQQPTPVPSQPIPTASTVPSAPALTEAPQTPLTGQQVKLSFVGDVIFSSTVEVQMKKNGYDYPYTFVKDYLQKADYTVANLETPITVRGEVQKKDYVYRGSPLALPPFKDAGVDLVNLANNHVMDYGKEGLLDTFDELKKVDIKYIGAGKDAAEAYSPVIVEKQGIKIAFLGFSRVVPEGSWKAGVNHPGVAETYSYTMPVEAIQKARQQADLVVVIAHWGVERTDNPDKFQTELAHRYIDAGADLIVASHPHVLQGFENYKGKWIAYSLGNFIFTVNEVQKTLESVILQATCSKEKRCDLDLVPIQNKVAQPEIMAKEKATKLFERLSQISIQAKVNEAGRVVPLQTLQR
ncbi:CapA family protein [Paenibacillus sp. GP183]|uniref:CapA family protein n=1 Tax=Paenibacillus sp. GP183 TaxID=1882751 RepID=UPI00089D993A|nr:CapA family protein [Paenibacillus sp. GP183]SEB77817.1 poly-gamma-glutamate synthesis protein (capsule biosynthesis protein) [Paenibacillus sp. GP183]